VCYWNHYVFLPSLLQVKVLGEGYTPEDEEDSSVAEVTAVNVYQARYRVPVARATAGNLVLIEGIDATITKTATLVAEAYDEPVCIFRFECVDEV
jgi:U5 small nuclear ribonucleoprotein component